MIGLLLATVVAIGCEVVVPGDIAAYSCTGLASDVACPAGKVCFSPLGQCVDSTAVCALLKCPAGSQCDPNSATCGGSEQPDATAPTDSSAPVSSPDAAPVDAAHPPDADASADVTPTTPPDAAGPCRDVGCRCAGATDCASGICGDTLTLTSDVVAATQSNVCTKPCCTSLDCDAGSVCFAAGDGGNYCVRAASLQRAVPTARNPAGTTCTTDATCASARCVGGMCEDTCCSASATSCPVGMACALGRFPGKATFDNHYTFACVASTASGKDGDNCNRASDCRSGLCEPGCVTCGSQCRPACRNTAECGSGFQCADVTLSPAISTNDVGVFCLPAAGSAGTKAVGTACTRDTECLSGTCDTHSNACTDTCFADADCAGAPAGWRCRPTIVTINGGGSYSVLSCGP